MLVLADTDASCEPGESFAVAIERIERGLSEADARAEIRAQHATAAPHEPFGALVPCDAADLILAPVLSAGDPALVRAWLANTIYPSSLGESAQRSSEVAGR